MATDGVIRIAQRTPAQEAAFARCKAAREASLAAKAKAAAPAETPAVTPPLAGDVAVPPQESAPPEPPAPDPEPLARAPPPTPEPAPAPEEEEDDEMVDFDPEDVYFKLNEATDEIKALRAELKTLKDDHTGLRDSFVTHHVKAADMLQFV